MTATQQIELTFCYCRNKDTVDETILGVVRESFDSSSRESYEVSKT
jgi:hypothetical protein